NVRTKVNKNCRRLKRKMKLYSDLADYYYVIEKENRNIDNDIRMIKTLIKEIKNPSLLDIGCGTGEHIDKLSKLNIDCTGIDYSISMLKIAKFRFPNSGQFIHKDMRNFSFNEKFDIVISLFGSFDYMIEDVDVNAMLKNTWNALRPGGIGIFEVWNAIPIREIKKKPLTLVSEIKYNNEIIKRERGFSLVEDRGKTVVQVNYKYIFPNKKIIKDQHVMRAFTRTEIAYYLENNEFDVIAFYANSLMELYNDMSNKIIVQFRKNTPTL
ncbi:MAG: class I SAM-dependent methyltransferase, partial [Spirochaetales bacterium]|nr:class I SAM-dependent methyltransferase [Spirochaetales bacterium]